MQVLLTHWRRICLMLTVVIALLLGGTIPAGAAGPQPGFTVSSHQKAVQKGATVSLQAPQGNIEHVAIPYAPMTMEQKREIIADMNLGPQKLAERDAAMAKSKACAGWQFSLFAVFTGYNATGPSMGMNFTYCGNCVGSLAQKSYGRPIAENPVSSGTAESWVEYGRSGYTNTAMNCIHTTAYYYRDWVHGSFYEQWTGAGYWNVPYVSTGNRMWRINGW